MYLYKSAKSDMTDATANICPELSRHWPKRLARRMGIPLRRARYWIYEGMPAARRREIALALVAECDRLADAIAETRKRWAEVADDEAIGAEAGGDVDQPRAAPRGMGEPPMN